MNHKRKYMFLSIIVIVFSLWIIPGQTKLSAAGTSLKLNKSVLYMKVGMSKEIIAKVNPLSLKSKIKYTSENKKVAKVNTYGVVKAVGKGTTNVVVSVKGTNMTAKCRIRVRNKSDKIKIGVIGRASNESGYQRAVNKHLKKRFTAANGYSAKFYFSVVTSNQVKNASKMIKEGVEYLIIKSYEGEYWNDVLKEAKAKNVKVILYDIDEGFSSSQYTTFITINMYTDAKAAVKWLNKQNLDSYKIIHIQGVMGSEVQKGRSRALEEKVDSEDNWKIVCQMSADWDEEHAQQIVQSVFEAGEEFNVIYAESDDMAKGAIAALDNAGLSHGYNTDIIVISFDGNKWMLDSLYKGKINCEVLFVTDYAHYIDKVIKQLDSGKKVNKTIKIKSKTLYCETITKADVKKYGI